MISSTFWRGRRVFLTGHTGFKGTWLTHWLTAMDAKVIGYALAPDRRPNLFEMSNAEARLAGHHVADIRDLATLTAAMKDAKPDLVIHMAAQPLVRRSYTQPTETWAVNVMGTVHVLEASRACDSVAAILAVTTDKCYENKGWVWGYREIDALGGYDPYSASKAASELVVQSHRKAFLDANGLLLASGRAGNVIGGGDWSEDRLIPDAARAVAAGQTLKIRSPLATRPWQHVLDCLSGYLVLSQALLAGDGTRATAYNFGPSPTGNIAVGDLVKRLQVYWPELKFQFDVAVPTSSHEAAVLYLDSAKAATELNWTPRWDIDGALLMTAAWYRAILSDPTSAAAKTEAQIADYMVEMSSSSHRDATTGV